MSSRSACSTPGWCVFDGRRAELLALARLLAQADATIVVEADKAVAHLGDLKVCADRAGGLSTLTPPPTEAEKLLAVGEARALAEAQLVRFHTRQPVDLDALRHPLPAARTSGYPLLVARLLYAIGLAEGLLGSDVGVSRTHLEEALVAAVSGGDRVAQTQIAAALVRVLGKQLGEPDRARFWGDFAKASLAALGSRHDGLEYEVAESLGLLAWDTGDVAEATRQYQKALEVAERTRIPPDRSRRSAASAWSATSVATSSARSRSPTVQLGPQPRPGGSCPPPPGRNFGFKGRYDEGFELASRALGIMEVAFDKNNPDLAYSLTLLAQFRSSQGRPGRRDRLPGASLALGRDPPWRHRESGG